MAAPRRRRASIRLWQTELFVVVIVVAILILSGSLSAGLEDTLSDIARDAELRNASALARRLQPEFPPTEERLARVRDVLAEYRAVYGGGIWVYDAEGTLLEAAYDVGPGDETLARARAAGLADRPDFTSMDLRPAGWVVSSRAILGDDGVVEGAVVTASPVDESLRILGAVRSRLWTTFWISLVVAGLLGFGFAELIARRIREMSDAAAAIEAGDFEQRLPLGLVPNEVQDLAVSYNRMAEKLGVAFGELEESRRQIATVVESMAEGVVAVDAECLVRVVNPEALRLLSRPGYKAAGLAAEQLTAEPAVLEALGRGLAGESLARTAAVGSFHVLLHCTPLYDDEGAVDGAVLLLRDVTEQQRVEEAQRRFVADASHEMRTPIAAIKGMLELLEDGAIDDPEVRDDFIHTMQVESDRLGRLVADLLTLAQLEAGSLRLRPSTEYASDLLGDVARVMHALAEQAEVTLAVDIAEPELRVVGDRDRLVQVLLSFTDNALKHSPAGSTVRLHAERVAEGVLLAVTDEGPGIEPEQLARVFERFYRADAARAGRKGTGLGLAIAKEIVEAHGATIEVDSAPGAGTTFRFTLPEAGAGETLTQP